MNIDILTVVWGPWHTDILVHHAIPSLLSPGNLPTLARSFGVAFHIYTTADDAKVIEASPSYQILKRIVHAEIVARPGGFEKDARHVIHWHKASGLSKRAGNFLCAIPPDMVWADGAFATVERLLSEGKRAIYAVFLRVASESFLEAYEGPPIQPRQLADLAIRHLHPLHRCYYRGSYQVPRHRECALWGAPGGILMRSLATTVLVYHAGEYSLNEHFSLAKPQSDICFVTDSDQIMGVSLAPEKKDSDWYLEGGKADFESTGNWWIHFAGETHDDLARQRFWFHSVDLEPKVKRIAELRSDAYVTQAMIVRDMIGVLGVLKDTGCGQAAELLKAAIYTTRFRRQWKWRFPITVFVPSNAVFRKTPSRYWKQLASDAPRLIQFLLDHVLAGEAIPGTHWGVRGNQLRIEDDGVWMKVNGLKVIHRYGLPRGNVVCVIDRTLVDCPSLQVQDRV